MITNKYFKDIYPYLSRLYPDTNVYVTSDQHFFHKNILDYERNQFNSVEEMNDYIISEHNKVVNNDDIVIFLGDFSFKSNEINNLLNRLNGHKFILLGNHDDQKTYLKKYSTYGFEDIFIYPVKFENNYLSHYPFKGEHPDDVNYSVLLKEFNINNGINIHGHIHSNDNDFSNSINVSVEHQDYKPIFIGKTSKLTKRIKSPFIINDSAFLDLLNFLVKEKNLDLDLLMSDFIYAMMIEAAGSYNDDVFFSGSYTLNKKYGLRINASDLDCSLKYNPNLTKKQNSNLLKEYIDNVYMVLKDFEGFNVSFNKRMPNINIIDNIFLDKSGNKVQTYLDANITPPFVYVPKDFISFKGSSVLEKYCNIYMSNYSKDFYFPFYEANFLNTNGDISNLVLQYLYQLGYPEKKKEILHKLNIILNNFPNEDFNNLNNLEDTLIRFLIRNILFFKTVKRDNEIIAIQNGKHNIDQIKNSLPRFFNEYLNEIINNPNSEYNEVFNNLTKSSLNDIETVSKEILEEKVKTRILK